MLTGALGHAYSTDDAAKNIVLLTADAEREGILGAAEEELRSATGSTLEWGDWLLTEFYQAVVEHGTDKSVYVVVAQIFRGVLLAIGGSIALLIDMAEHDGLLLILLDIDNHTVVIVHWIVDALGSILGHGDGRENLLDLLLHLVYVDITHDDNSLKVRAIPLLVIVAQVLIREVVDDVHRTDRHAILVLGTFVDFRHGLLHESLNGHTGTTCAPLFVDDTTLLVDLGIFEQQIVTPVVEHQQARVDDTLALERCRTDVINSLIDRGIGIEVGTKLNADSLAPGHDAQALALARKVLCTVKCHVLEEVSQTTLAGLLQNRTHTLGNIEIGQTSLLSIVADIIGHAILKLTLADGGILW